MVKQKTGRNPGFVVVEGPIGVGKTSLAKRLATSFGSDLLLEDAEDNPFLGRFYQDPRGAALPTQLSFLFQRVRQLQSLRQADMFAPVRVADYLMDKDQLFARLTLDEDELRLYEQVYVHTVRDVPKPDLVIYLQAPVEVLRARIARRGDARERSITVDYLRRVVEAYADFFHRYDAAPLLIVNAAQIDIVNSDADYVALLDHVGSTPTGRRYFNPLSTA